MTRDQVEQLIGGPPGSYSRFWFEEIPETTGDFIPHHGPPIFIHYRVWVKNGLALIVAYRDDKLTDKLLVNSTDRYKASLLLHERIADAFFDLDLSSKSGTNSPSKN